MLSYTPYTYSGSWTQSLQVMLLWLQFGSAWYRWSVITNDKNNLTNSGLLWAGHLCWFYFLIFHKGPNLLMQIRLSQIHQWYGLRNQISQSVYLHLGFHWVSHVNKMGTHGSNIFGTFYSSSWNGLHCWVVKLVLLICRSVGSNHFWNLTQTYVSYHSLSYPKIGRYFPFLPFLIPIWFMSLRVCFVRKLFIRILLIFMPIILFYVMRNIDF